MPPDTASSALSSASWTALEGLSRHLTSHAISPLALAAITYLVWLGRITSSALSSASWTALEGLSRHLTACLGRNHQFGLAWPHHLVGLPARHLTACLGRNHLFGLAWPHHLQRLEQCLMDCFARPLTPSHRLPWPQSPIWFGLATSPAWLARNLFL